MTIPEYQSFMRPVLEGLADREPRAIPELARHAADALGVPAPARAAVLPWNQQPVLEARVDKAAQDLGAAGLLQRDGRALALTPEGASVLEAGPETVDKRYLLRFEAFAAYEQARLSRRGA